MVVTRHWSASASASNTSGLKGKGGLWAALLCLRLTNSFYGCLVTIPFKGLTSKPEEHTMHPFDAKSPKWRIEDGSIKVIYSNLLWSLAKMKYDGTPALGIRWNGDINDRNDLGYPSARGSNGAWFILPPEVEPFFLAMLEIPRNILKDHNAGRT